MRLLSQGCDFLTALELGDASQKQKRFLREETFPPENHVGFSFSVRMTFSFVDSGEADTLSETAHPDSKPSQPLLS